MIAAQPPATSSSWYPSSASSLANSVSERMSTRQPVSRAARRAFWPSLPIASDSWSSGTITVACLFSSSTSTSRTRAGDILDLHQAVGDLRHLELEQLADELGRAARDDDARTLRLRGDVRDDRLDALAVVVALVVDLLGLRQQRLHPLAQLHERVAGVGLLDDAGDQLADAVLVLLEHHVALGLADALQDHLLGGLGGDAPEVVRRDVALVDLVAVLLELDRVDLGLLGLAHLPGLGVDGRVLVDGLDEELRLEPLGDDQLEDLEVAGGVVDLDAGVLG